MERVILYRNMPIFSSVNGLVHLQPFCKGSTLNPSLLSLLDTDTLLGQLCSSIYDRSNVSQSDKSSLYYIQLGDQPIKDFYE